MRSSSYIDPYARDHQQLGSSADIPPLLDRALRSADGSGDIVIDIGAGEGLTLVAIQRRGASGVLLALDLSLERTRVARARGFHAVVADATKLPLRPSSVGLVICRHVIEHVPDDVALLREISRVLGTNAGAYIETPIRLRGAWYPYRNATGQWVLDPTHIREYGSMMEVQRLVAESGLGAIALHVQPIRYSIAHVLYRLLGPRRRPRPFAVAVLDRRWPLIRIPRYREAHLLVGVLPPVTLKTAEEAKQ